MIIQKFLELLPSRDGNFRMLITIDLYIDGDLCFDELCFSTVHRV